MRKLNSLAKLKSFVILWSSQSLSSLGSAMTAYALIVRTYRQQGTALSVSLLAFCTYLPSTVLSFAAGTLADRWDKKKVMLLGDLTAAAGTAALLLLYTGGALRIWHIYVVNVLISCMNAFQNPASCVAVSLLVPKEHYVRASGIQSFASSLISVLSPALATAVLSLAGMNAVFCIDLATFAAAFFSLLFFIKIPAASKDEQEQKEPLFKSCLQGIAFLREHSPLLKLILYMSLINFLAYTSGYGILPAMVLSRSGGNETLLGMVSSPSASAFCLEAF